MNSVRQEAVGLLAHLGVPDEAFHKGDLEVSSPITGEVIGCLPVTAAADVCRKIEESFHAFRSWRKVAPPRRGELIRLFAEELRTHKETLGRLVTLEARQDYFRGLRRSSGDD